MSLIKEQKGAIAILVILILPLLIGFVGLALDTANLLYQKQKLQDAVDFSALAGAAELINNPGNAVQAAKDYGELNGLERGKIRVSTPYNKDPDRIYVETTKTIDYAFLTIIGIHSTTITVSAIAESSIRSSNPAFDYVFFSGSETDRFEMPGSRNTINGKVHINSYVKMSGSNNLFNSNFECVGSFTAHSSDYFQNLLTNSNVMPMVQYDINDLKARATKIYDNDVNYSNIEINGIIFVNGDVNISGGKVKGKGTIIATGKINISASRLIYESVDDVIAFYSLQDIGISGSDIIVDGLFYAPNGLISIPGSRNTFNGGFVAQQLKISGSDSQYTYDPRLSEVVSLSSERLIHLVQ